MKKVIYSHILILSWVLLCFVPTAKSWNGAILGIFGIVMWTAFTLWAANSALKTNDPDWTLLVCAATIGAFAVFFCTAEHNDSIGLGLFSVFWFVIMNGGYAFIGNTTTMNTDENDNFRDSAFAKFIRWFYAGIHGLGLLFFTGRFAIDLARGEHVISFLR